MSYIPGCFGTCYLAEDDLDTPPPCVYVCVNDWLPCFFLLLSTLDFETDSLPKPVAPQFPSLHLPRAGSRCRCRAGVLPFFSQCGCWGSDLDWAILPAPHLEPILPGCGDYSWTSLCSVLCGARDWTQGSVQGQDLWAELCSQPTVPAHVTGEQSRAHSVLASRHWPPLCLPWGLKC